MGLSDADVQKQLRHMMAFIEQEANEKAEEIDAKAEEEFNIEKGRLVQQQRTKIMEFYEKKEKQVELQRKIQSSNMLNAARLKVLKAREDHIKNVLDEARAKLSHLGNDQAQYPTILRGLILQALCQLLESEAVLRCREKDVQLVESLMPACLEELKKNWGKEASKISIDRKNFLPPDSNGGVEIYAKEGKIRVISTLDSRLEAISHKMIPEIRGALFGKNPNRKFND